MFCAGGQVEMETGKGWNKQSEEFVHVEAKNKKSNMTYCRIRTHSVHDSLALLTGKKIKGSNWSIPFRVYT